MELLERIYAQARDANATIVLAEAQDARIIEAAVAIEQDSLANLILIGDPAVIRSLAGSKPLKARIIDPKKEITTAMVECLIAARAKETLTKEQARELLRDTKFLAATLVKLGQADGYVAGNQCTTAETIRPALKVLGTTGGFASSYFLMLYQDRPLFFADCGFNIDPTAEQLAQIAIDTAASAQRLGITPRIAFLSCSTHGSAQHPRVDKMRTAYELAHAKAPTLIMDGELQFDAAFVPSVAHQKAPDSLVQGQASIFIFPDLDSGNIAYKIAQRMGGCSAIGPVLQGFAKPVNDLSRGCSAQDIVDVVAITAMQSRR